VRIEVRPLQRADAERCDAIMRSLPDWFGYEPGLVSCSEAVRSQSGWVGIVDGEVAGFATWERRTDATAEVTWMAVHGERRSSGVGTAIIERLCEELRAQAFALALAMTSGAHKVAFEGPDPYDETRAFWFARGFHPLIELDIWETDMALLMVRPLG
jgi:GNAT superfamily N-acetyltransferase